MNNKETVDRLRDLKAGYTWEIVYPYQRRHYKQVEDAEFEDIE